MNQNLSYRIASGNPHGAIDLIKSYGLSAPSANETGKIASTLDWMVKKYQDQVWSSLINIHPDKNLFGNNEVKSNYSGGCSGFNAQQQFCNCCGCGCGCSNFNAKSNKPPTMREMQGAFNGEERAEPLFKNGFKDVYPVAIVALVGALGIWALMKGK